MKIKIVTGILMLLLVGLVAGSGCKGVGGAEVRLEGISLGQMSMEGKTLSGLPSDKVDIILKASTSQVSISTSAEGTIIKLNPSGGTVTIRPNGVSMTGLKPEQVEIKWRTPQTGK